MPLLTPLFLLDLALQSWQSHNTSSPSKLWRLLSWPTLVFSLWTHTVRRALVLECFVFHFSCAHANFAIIAALVTIILVDSFSAFHRFASLFQFLHWNVIPISSRCLRAIFSPCYLDCALLLAWFALFSPLTSLFLALGFLLHWSHRTTSTTPSPFSLYLSCNFEQFGCLV